MVMCEKKEPPIKEVLYILANAENRSFESKPVLLWASLRFVLCFSFFKLFNFLLKVLVRIAGT